VTVLAVWVARACSAAAAGFQVRVISCSRRYLITSAGLTVLLTSAPTRVRRLEPLCEHEFRGLTDGGRPAAIDAVVKVFGHTDLSDEALVGADVGAAEWARRIRSQAPPDPGLGEAAIAFYELLLAECCDCYVRLLPRLPVFTERAITELLGRVSSLGGELAQVLERLPARSLYAPVGDDHDEEFKHEYLGLISSGPDEVELFGGLAGPALARAIRPAPPAHRP
jgi:hypothetical protein